MKDKIDFENEVLDLDEIKNTLNENILHVFAAWIEYLLSKMFKGRRVPVRVRGNRIEVERFTDALVNEKDIWTTSRNMDLMTP